MFTLKRKRNPIRLVYPVRPESWEKFLAVIEKDEYLDVQVTIKTRSGLRGVFSSNSNGHRWIVCEAKNAKREKVAIAFEVQENISSPKDECRVVLRAADLARGIKSVLPLAKVELINHEGAEIGHRYVEDIRKLYSKGKTLPIQQI